MPSSCIYSPRHTSESGIDYDKCRGYRERRKKYTTPKGTQCCELDKHRRPKTGSKCGTIKIQGRGKVPLYKGKDGGVYYLTRTNNKIYIDSQNNIHKKPKGCGPGAQRKKTKSPKSLPSVVLSPPSEGDEVEWTHEELKKTGRPCSAHRSQHLCQIATDTREEHIRTTPDGKTKYHPRTCRWMHESLPSDERCQDLPEEFVESATLMQIPGEEKEKVEDTQIYNLIVPEEAEAEAEAVEESEEKEVELLKEWLASLKLDIEEDCLHEVVDMMFISEDLWKKVQSFQRNNNKIWN